MRDAPDIASEYLANAAVIKSLEAKQDGLRQELSARLSAHTVTQPTTWELGDARVVWVKGREKATLDRAKLVLQGVTAEVLDKATVKSVGKPSIRIEATDAQGAGTGTDEAGSQEGPKG